MIISPPFLAARPNNQADADYVATCMSGDSPGTGSYPVSHRLSWHGGMHLTAPAGTSGHLPIRAIADGTVVLVRQPTKKPADAQAQRKHALGYYRGWTDNGVVVIRHETEIGEGADAQVTFYSIYQHLHTIRPAIREGQSIYRKDELGQAGYIYGEPNRIQLEIVCDDANLRRLVGRTEGDVPLSADGRTDSVYGELYFALPEGTRILDRNPHARRQRGAPVPPAPVEVHTTTGALFVGIRYANGDATITTYPVNSGRATIGSRTDTDYEFELQAEATRLYPDCPSAGYELLRFGRILGPDALAPQDAEHWRKIHYPGGEGWVNLNAIGVRKFSDADFPHWRGWFLIDDDATVDSRCNSSVIIRLLDSDNDGTATREEVERRLPLAPIRTFMKRLVCKFPSEWDAANLETRWGWLLQGSGQAVSGELIATEAESLCEADFDRLCAHLKELCFWDTRKIGIASNHWHFEPREFITSLRKCRWLSSSELAHIYPDDKYPKSALSTEGRGRTPATIQEQYRPELNKTTRKYMIETPTRMAHFYGQGAVESFLLTLMIEGSANFSRNPRHASFQPETDGYYIPASKNDYLYYLEGRLGNVDEGDGPKFRGRGMKQLTGRENYSKYWTYRGWLDPNSFDPRWWDDTERLQPPTIDTPQALSTNDYNCIDAGGWYWEAGAARARFRSINSVIAENDVSNAEVERVTRAINGGINGLAQRIAHTQRIAPILDDTTD